MNNRFFIHQITVYHTEDDENFTIQHYNGKASPQVYFRHNKKTNLVDKGLQEGSTGSITIPTAETLLFDTALKISFRCDSILRKISTNDYIVEGIIEDKFDLSALQQKYQVFKVVSIDDNRKGGLPHYKIGVNE